MELRLLPAALSLLMLLSCGSSDHDAAFWRTARCPQLNGIRFKVTLYKDNIKAYDDVLFFRHDTLISEKWYAAGYHTSAMACREQPSGEIMVKTAMVNGANDWLQYVISFANGEPDGTLTQGSHDGASFTYTFAGHEE